MIDEWDASKTRRIKSNNEISIHFQNDESKQNQMFSVNNNH